MGPSHHLYVVYVGDRYRLAIYALGQQLTLKHVVEIPLSAPILNLVSNVFCISHGQIFVALKYNGILAFRFDITDAARRSQVAVPIGTIPTADRVAGMVVLDDGRLLFSSHSQLYTASLC